MVLDSVCKISKSYLPRIFIEQCKCKGKVEEIVSFIPKLSSSSSSDDDDDNNNESIEKDSE